MRFVFIAVNYNGAEYTKDYIRSVLNLTVEKDCIEVIVVDNCSEYSDYESLVSFVSRLDSVEIIRSQANVGYFGGLNIGILHTKKDSETYVIIGNNDLTFDQEFVMNLKKIRYDPSVMIIAPDIITKDGIHQNPHVVDKVSRTEKLKSMLYFSNYFVGQLGRIVNRTVRKVLRRKKVHKTNRHYQSQMIIKRGIGACYVLTPNFFKSLDKLDDRIFLWGEEALLSAQVESVGGKTLYDPSIVVHHHESASVNAIEPRNKYNIVKDSYKIYRKYL